MKVMNTLMSATMLSGMFSLASAQMAPTSIFTFAAESRLWIEGTSSVKAFKCFARTINSELQSGPEGPGAALESLVRAGRVSVEVAELDCANGTMNDHMRKALKSKDNPTIAFTLESYRINGSEAAVVGKLQIAGKENAITFPAIIIEEGNLVRVKAAQSINMKDWGVKPPSLMLGAMKVNELVSINFDVTIKR
jgi:hypothetical protein